MAVEYRATLTWFPVANAVFDWAKEDTINTLRPAPGTATIAFSYAPTLATAVSYTAGSTTYTPTDSNGSNYHYIQKGVPITFTAVATLSDPEIRVLEYLWDFGDGTTGYGNPVTKTFTALNLTGGQVILRLTDTAHRYFYTRQAIYVHA